MTTASYAATPLQARNPATGALLGEFPTTGGEDVESRTSALRERSAAWASTPLTQRLASLKRWAAILSRDAERWADQIRDEIGKPRVEALVEVVATLDALRWTYQHARKVLRERKLGPGFQRWMLFGVARVRPCPRGLVGMIGTWNYPLLLNATPLAQALAAGNVVVWKPSELATACGALLHENLREAGLAPQFVDTVNGAGHVGQRLIDGPIDHCVFTGGVGVGRQVLQRLGSRGVPAVAELSGFDPAIVLPDADLESTVRNLCWSAFVSAGQTCVAVKRVYVLEKLDEWSERFERAATSLRVGDPASGDIDMGPLISDAARQRFLQFVANAVQAGAKLLTGGTAIDGPGYFVRPTVLVAEDGAAEQALAGVFGPLLILRRVPTVDDALAAANASPYGLAASVWGRDRRLLRATAQRLNAGVVSINDAVSPAGHAAAPFGGVKASGYGRTHGPYGLLEFTQPVALHERNHGSWRPQLYPYSQRLWKLLSLYKKFVHRA